MPGLDPGIVTAARTAAAEPPVMMAGSSPAMTNGSETDGGEAVGSNLHSACMSPQDADPAASLPTRRRRAVNRARAAAAPQ
jgi:hypothetical protein